MLARRFLVILIQAVPEKVKHAFALILFPLLLAGALFAQQPETTVSLDAGKLQELLGRIADLEQSQKQLLARVAQLEAQSGAHDPVVTSTPGQVASSSSSPSLVLAGGSPKADQTKPAPGNGQQSDQSPMLGGTEHMDVSRTALNIRGFGDFGFYGGNQNGQTSSFSIGQTNLFITSDLSEKVRFLTELVFEVH